MTTRAKDGRFSTASAGARWKRHLASWRAYALAGGASVAAGTNADAQIVFVDNSLSGDAATSSFKFAVNGHLVIGFQSRQPGIGGSSFGTALLGGRAVGGRAGIKFYQSQAFGLNYEKGAVIGRGPHDLGSAVGLRYVHKSGGGAWSTQGNFGAVNGQPTRAAEIAGYVGFKTSGGDIGWIKVRVGPSGNTNAGVAITVEAYAYNSTPGGPITAGDTGAVPEPGTMALALMAAGAAGLASIRRARARVASEASAQEKVVAS